jgi:hypothetical protein
MNTTHERGDRANYFVPYFSSKSSLVYTPRLQGRFELAIGSSLTRSRLFELSFWYVRLKTIIMLGCGGKPLIGHSSC